MLPQDGRGGQHLEGGRVTATGQDHVGVDVLVVAGPVPDADALGAVHDGLVHGQPLGHGALAGHHHVHVVAAAQAVVGHRQQAVGVRWEVDPDDVGLLVHHVVEEPWVLMGEAVVVLLPHVGREEVVERGDPGPPREVPRDLQPLGVLVEHGVDDVDEGLVAVEEPVPAGQQVALQPALALVLAQHRIEHPAVAGQELVVLPDGGVPLAVGHLEHRTEQVGQRLVGPEDPEVAVLLVESHHVAEELAQHLGVPGVHRAGGGDGHGVVAEVGHAQVVQQQPAVGVGVGPHAALAVGGQLGQLGPEPAGGVEQLLGAVAAHPVLQHLEVLGVLGVHHHRHLVGPEGPLDRQPVDHLRARPALGRP